MPVPASAGFTPQEIVLLWLQNAQTERAQGLRNAVAGDAQTNGSNYYGLLIEAARTYAGNSPTTVQEATAWLNANPTYANRNTMNGPAVGELFNFAGVSITPRILAGAVVVLILILIFK
jgi:hypothetical protein